MPKSCCAEAEYSGPVKSDLAALGAVLLWASLATLSAGLAHIPPLLMTGIGLLIGSLLALPLSRFQLSKLKVSPKLLAIGVYGLFGFHLALFAALQNAPAVQANLVNYLWPLLIVILAPAFTGGTLKLKHVLSAVAGFVGAALAILSGAQLSGGLEIGYLYALIAAVIWATYSLLTKRFGAFSTSAIGTFAFVSGLLAIAAHFVFEPAASITSADWLILVVMGLGPLGGAFYLWDYALKHGSAQRVGLISFATPLLSTLFLLLSSGQIPTPLLLVSAALIVGAAYVGRGD
jgi:drug/metabolite transporter (DMT)-like permease